MFGPREIWTADLSDSVGNLDDALDCSTIFCLLKGKSSGIFEMAAMPFPSKGLMLCCVNLPFFNKFASCSVPYFHFFIGDCPALALCNFRWLSHTLPQVVFLWNCLANQNFTNKLHLKFFQRIKAWAWNNCGYKYTPLFTQMNKKDRVNVQWRLLVQHPIAGQNIQHTSMLNFTHLKKGWPIPH